MAVGTREEALVFVDAMRLTIEGKVGFKWMTERLSELREYLDTLAGENEQLNAFIDQSGARDAYAVFSASVSHDDAGGAADRSELAPSSPSQREKL